MFTKILIGLLVIGTLLGSVVSLSSAADGRILDEPVLTAGMDPSNEAPQPPPLQTSQSFVERARRWVEYGVARKPNAKYEGYSVDDAGLIAFAWKLPATINLAHDLYWKSATREPIGVAIPPQMLEPGDALTNLQEGESGHAVLFVAWADSNRWSEPEDFLNEDFVRRELREGVQFVAYEIDPRVQPRRAVESTYTLEYRDGNVTIKELDSTYKGPYHAIRYRELASHVVRLGGLRATRSVRVGQAVKVQYTLVNRGGQPLRLSNPTVVAFGPDADRLGLRAPQVNFPLVKQQIVVQPGHAYTYDGVKVFKQAGEYKLMLRYDIDGSSAMPLEAESLTVSQ